MKRGWTKATAILLLLVMLPLQALAYTKLQKGDEGPEVLRMQAALQSLGYSITADGKYGPATVSVVKAFQRKHGLTADGIAGDKTLTLLYSLASGATAPPAATATPAISGGRPATVRTSGGSLNLRKSASSSAAVLAAIPNGTVITVLAQSGGWALAVYQGITGYVMTQYLVFSGSASTPSPTPVPTPTPGASGLQARVVTTGGSLNLRKTASSGATVIATIPYGAWVTVLNRGSSWCRVTYNGLTGYVMTKFLSFGSTAPTASPTAAPTAIPGVETAFVNTTGGSLNLRQEPKSSARVLRTIPNGAPVQVLSRGSAWCAVSYQGTAGYVMTSFLRFVGTGATAVPTAAPTAAPVPAGETAYVSTSGGALNLRESPSSGAKILRTIPNGALVTVHQRGSVWCGVSYQGVVGYVMAAYLRFPGDPTAAPTQTPSPVPTPTATLGASIGTAIVTTSGGSVNLRAQASESAAVLCSVPNAATVTIYTRGSVWSAVTYQGTFGYIMSKYLTFLGSSPGYDGEDEEDDPSEFHRVLKKGMTGADVTWVQNRLVELGYLQTVTNIYDDATFNAVKAFQTMNGLTADGLAGEQTFALLKSANALHADDQPLTYSTLRIDQTGDGVRQLQTDLKALGYPVSVDGTYGVDTHDAVVAFQQRNGLVISGIADALTRQVLHSGRGKPYSTPVEELPANTGWMAAPAVSQLKLLHWQNEVKPSVKTGQAFTVLDPNTNLSWKLVFYSLGRHADCQPATWKDTQIMNRSFSKGSWTIHPVYVLLPSGQWTLATMHNRPHLYGSITNNGFGGHLCVHFLRDMAEAQRNDPKYGVNNQVTLRNAWKALTGQTVD